MRVLSIDLASLDPNDLGIALLTSDATIRVELVPPDRLSLMRPLQVGPLADALVALAEGSDCRWIAVDGPSGWKHPDNGLIHSRVSDRALNAPAKVGLPGHVKPRPYLKFVDFSIALFDALADRGYARLASAATPAGVRTSVEILPLVCWSRLNLPRLPAKSKCTPEALSGCSEALSTLVSFVSPPGHDELQATIGGIGVLWQLLGWSDRIELAGSPPVLLDGYWREGLILAPSIGLLD